MLAKFYGVADMCILRKYGAYLPQIIALNLRNYIILKKSHLILLDESHLWLKQMRLFYSKQKKTKTTRR